MSALWGEAEMVSVFVNGKRREVLGETLFSAFPPKENMVIILNGFQVNVDFPIKEDD